MFNKEITKKISSLITLNNQGVSLLQQGNQRVTAIAKFRLALDALRSIDVINELSNDNEQDTNPIHIPCNKIMSSVSVSFHEDCIDYGLSAASSPHNMHCFFARAFVLNPILCHEASNVDLTLVILYNMGIACHQHGLLLGNYSTFYLQKALGLYKMIAALVSDYPNHHNSFQNDQETSLLHLQPNTSLLLALWSNMSHIYAHFFQNFEVSECRLQLVNICSIVKNNMQYSIHGSSSDTTRSESTDIEIGVSQSLSVDEYRALLFNAVLTVNVSTVTRAPAA